MRPALLALALGVTACQSPPPPRALAWPSANEWRGARSKISELRKRAGSEGARTMRLGLALREPFTGKIMNARGAVAIKPPSSLRMILLGPGGTTALDFWLEGDRFRFTVPPIDLVRRGDAKTPRASMRGLPIDFLGWWMLRPADGTLIYEGREPEGERFVMRDGRAVVDLLVKGDGALRAERTLVEPTATGELRVTGDEIVDADRIGCGSVHYVQPTTGLDIHVTCEGEEKSPPDPRAFIDPDEAEKEP